MEKVVVIFHDDDKNGGSYEAQISSEEGFVVIGCDCADSIEDVEKLKKIRDALDSLIVEKLVTERGQQT